MAQMESCYVALDSRTYERNHGVIELFSTHVQFHEGIIENPIGMLRFDRRHDERRTLVLQELFTPALNPITQKQQVLGWLQHFVASMSDMRLSKHWGIIHIAELWFQSLAWGGSCLLLGHSQCGPVHHVCLATIA